MGVLVIGGVTSGLAASVVRLTLLARTVHPQPIVRRVAGRVPRLTAASSETVAAPYFPGGRTVARGYFALASPVESAAMNASWGTSTRPTIFMRFLPSFCFSSSLRLRLMSPP